MPDAMENAAVAFDAVIQSEAKPVGKTGNVDRSEGPPEALFKNVGQLDDDTDAKGGGDDLEDPIYGSEDSKPKKDASRNSNGKSGPDDDDSDEESGDPDPDEQDGDDETDEEGGEGPDEEATLLAREVEVSVDGEPVKVSIKEALEGYVRTETFHQRMNQLDEAKKIVRRAAADAVQNYQYAQTIAQQMEAHMAEFIPKEPDWDAEFQKDPVRARELQRYYEKANAFRAKIQSEMGEAAKKMEESNSTQLRAFVEEETQKFDRLNAKNWSDPKKKAKDLSSMHRTGIAAGFSEDELSQVYDSRMLMVLLKASKYDRMMAARPKPIVRQQAKPVPPGAGSAKQRTAQKGVNSAMKRLNRTGSIEDAAAVFDQILAKG